MNKQEVKILSVSVSGTSLHLCLDTDTHTDIKLDMTAFLENGRKFLDFDPAALLRGAMTDGTNLSFPLEEKTAVEVSYNDLVAMVFGDPVAVSEKVFAMTPGADIWQMNPHVAERCVPFPRTPADMTDIRSVCVDGNTLEFEMANAASPVIRLDMTAYLERAKALCPFEPNLLLKEIARGDVKLWLCVEGNTMAEMYWIDLRILTFNGESVRIANKTLESARNNWNRSPKQAAYDKGVSC